MKHLRTMWQAGVTAALVGLPQVALAQGGKSPFESAQELVGDVGKSANLGEPKPLTQIVGQIINVVLGFLGVVLLGYLLFAGFKWMTAGGDEKQVGEAKGMIKNAIIGLIVIVAAFAISTFVLGSLVNATAG